VLRLALLDTGTFEGDLWSYEKSLFHENDKNYFHLDSSLLRTWLQNGI